MFILQNFVNCLLTCSCGPDCSCCPMCFCKLLSDPHVLMGVSAVVSGFLALVVGFIAGRASK